MTGSGDVEAPVVSAALMMAMLRPPVGRDEDFNDWYDTEHAPARAAVPGFLTARRWRAVAGWNGTGGIDEIRAAAERAEPLHYLATFDLSDASVLDGDDYLRARATASPRERRMNEALTANDRRVYRPLPLPAESRSTELDICGPLMLLVWWDPDRPASTTDVERSFGPHAVRAASAPGVRRVRLFERSDAPGSGRFAASYDIESLAALSRDAGTPTDWLGHALDHPGPSDARLYRLWRRFDASPVVASAAVEGGAATDDRHG